jgi:hypothetical protein
MQLNAADAMPVERDSQHRLAHSPVQPVSIIRFATESKAGIQRVGEQPAVMAVRPKRHQAHPRVLLIAHNAMELISSAAPALLARHATQQHHIQSLQIGDQREQSLIQIRMLTMPPSVASAIMQLRKILPNHIRHVLLLPAHF